MLWAFLAYLLLSSRDGAAAGYFTVSEYAKAHVESTIQDEERRKAALHALSKLEKDVDALNEGVEKNLDRFQELVQDYGSKPEDFDRLFDSGIAADLRQLDQIWNDRAELLAPVRPDEWSTIVAGARADAAKAAAKAHEGKTE